MVVVLLTLSNPSSSCSTSRSKTLLHITEFCVYMITMTSLCWYFLSFFPVLPYLLHCAEASFLYVLSIELMIEVRYITADVLALSLIASSTLYTSIFSERVSVI